jgi:hypothetical protein
MIQFTQLPPIRVSKLSTASLPIFGSTASTWRTEPTTQESSAAKVNTVVKNDGHAIRISPKTSSYDR